MDLLLGRLRELVVRGPRGLEAYRPENRWLSWDPHGRRLYSVRRGRELGELDQVEDLERVQGFHWDEDPAAAWQTFRPAGRPRRLDELAAVVYLAEKGGELAEWQHWFRRCPRAGTDGQGEWHFRGRVEVTDRGIVS